MHFKFDELYKKIIDDIANYSTCVYYKVGAIIVDTKNGNMVWGYNGTPKGFIECKDIDSMIEDVIIDPYSIDKYLDRFPKFVHIIDEVFNELLNYVGRVGKITDLEQAKRYLNIVHSKYEIHAEQNAILKFRLLDIDNRDRNKYPIIMYVSHAPCFECAKLIIASGFIDKVIYKEDYIDKRYNESSIDFLMDNGIEVYKM